MKRVIRNTVIIVVMEPSYIGEKITIGAFINNRKKIRHLEEQRSLVVSFLDVARWQTVEREEQLQEKNEMILVKKEEKKVHTLVP